MIQINHQANEAWVGPGCKNHSQAAVVAVAGHMQVQLRGQQQHDGGSRLMKYGWGHVARTKARQQQQQGQGTHKWGVGKRAAATVAVAAW